MSEITNHFEAFEAVHRILEPLDEEARSRVVQAVSALLGIDSVVQPAPVIDNENPLVATMPGTNNEEESSYSTFAELYDAADPGNNGEQALVAGYWLQECENAESFTAQLANRELANLGHKISNITSALGVLMESKPHLVLQLKKSGKSRQARKTYKLSKAGVTRVQEMIGE